MRFCRFLVSVFYRRDEVAGLENLIRSGPVILCANHVNALADAVVVQASCPRPIHPIARSGLFRNPVLKPILSFIQAVPIFRRPPPEIAAGETATSDRAVGETAVGKITEAALEAAAKDTAGNDVAFGRIYDYLADDRVILIFPEGQSHSDPQLRPLKTGAARLALGHLRRTGVMPKVVPVGLTFTQKGRFRASVLVHYGEPVEFDADLEDEPEEDERETVRRFTDRIDAGLRSVTLNMESWEDLALMRLMQQFFTLRDRRSNRPSLGRRFRSFQRLIEGHKALRAVWPDKVRILRAKLQRFEQLCQQHGVRDYQLHLTYTPGVVLRFLARTLIFLLCIFPLAVWGALNSAIPFLATRQLSQMSARGRDQYDTASMLYGLVLFGVFWGLQTFAVAWFWQPWPTAALYAASLPLTAMVALKVATERHRIQEEIRVFLLFLRKKELQAFLRVKRKELEVELARMARKAKEAKIQLIGR